MNIFRLIGDLSHLASIFILIQKIIKSRSARGISFKTQVLYVVVFLTRYVDLVTGPFISVSFHFHLRQVYNTAMKLFFIASSAYIVYLMHFKYKPTQDPAIDTFKVEYLLGPCALLALVFNYKLSVDNPHSSVFPIKKSLGHSILNTVYLQIHSILAPWSRYFGHSVFTWKQSPFSPNCSCSIGLVKPRQLPHIISLPSAFTVQCISPTGSSGSLNRLPLFFFWYTTENTLDPIAIFAGIVQTGLYADFFYSALLHTSNEGPKIRIASIDWKWILVRNTATHHHIRFFLLPFFIFLFPPITIVPKPKEEQLKLSRRMQTKPISASS
ncbi:ER lumen protein retaining receptor [Puccinia sorghi]|uniref:ER lumen protein retaining receptor n=1 Tax=Puccinia sorghi TaxID=27349 RepID=A0A0L6VEL7_9BASI|nr:ER lumen protein retaining receptor [Puccinia sorghi]